LNRKAVEESNLALQKTLEDLKAAQDQLVQQEKLASLGQLTAGIAHEIKNPLNFINNFSELSSELIDEVFEEMEQLDKSETTALIREILNDVKSNLQKVNEHGTRADSIVKSMLMHSRGSSGKKTPTDLNRLICDNATLTFHAMRAGKNPINVKIEYDLDERIGEVSIISEDFSRVIVNLCSNAFDAMREKTKTEPGYKPVLSMSTKQKEKAVEIAISDNGPGIPEEIKDKILQPFFTTKKGTEGTGLGLSITNDIVKAHGGELRVESKKGEGSNFIIVLPTQSL
jgi:signal transduction histidine kinase